MATVPTSVLSSDPSGVVQQPKKVGLLFGINYLATPNARLNGCINDVRNVGTLLQNNFGFTEVNVFDDERTPKETTLLGLVRNLQNLALRSWSEDLDLVWIHFSGHGTQVRDQIGTSAADEEDGKDEAWCPSDFVTAGMLRDDDIAILLSRFNPHTKVILVSDSCHSATVSDAKYLWASRTKYRISKTRTVCKSPLIMISGCQDHDTSSDAYLPDASGVMRAQGALTNCMLRAFKEDPVKNLTDVFSLVERTRYLLKTGGFAQVPQLSSSYDISQNPLLLL